MGRHCWIQAFLVALGCVTAACSEPVAPRPRAGVPAPVADHHQHFFRAAPQGLEGATAIDGDTLVRHLDDAGIARAVVLSVAYQSSNPNSPAAVDEYGQVREENDWTAAQVARHPGRLVGFCSVNPVKAYALPELERCAKTDGLATGLKLHFGNSDLRLEDPVQVAQLRDVFAAADRLGMAITVHLRPSVNQRRPYGAAQARIFLERLLPASPNVPVQIAHLGGAGGFDDPAIDEALEVFVQAIARNDARVRNLYFDVSGVAGLGDWQKHADRIVQRLRQLGLDRIVFGSDGVIPGNTPKEAWQKFGSLPLSDQELQQIARTQAPYMMKRAALGMLRQKPA